MTDSNSSIDINTFEGLSMLADAIDRYEDRNKCTGVRPSNLRAHATRLHAEKLRETEKIAQLAKFITNSVPGYEVDTFSAAKLARVLLNKFDIEYKDKTGPGLGESYDADDYK